MRVLFLTEGTETHASSRMRVYCYLPYLTRHGIQSHVWPRYTAAAMKVGRGLRKLIERRLSSLRLLGSILSASQYDLVMVQKILPSIWMQKLLHRCNGNLVYDFDDAVFIRAPQLKVGWVGRLQACWTHGNAERFEHMLCISKSAILVTRYNQEYASQHNPNTTVITGPIDTQRYHPRSTPPQEDRIVVGWIGSPLNTVYLEPVYGVL